MSNLVERVARPIVGALLICLFCFGASALAADGDPVSLEVNLVRIDELLLHVGEITNPQPNMGIVMFTEVFEGLWLQVVQGAEELVVLPLDESGQFALVAYCVTSQNDGKVLTPVEYVILDLDNVPEELSLENAEAAALCYARVLPEQPSHDEAFASAPDGRVLYPELDALLEKLAEE